MIQVHCILHIKPKDALYFHFLFSESGLLIFSFSFLLIYINNVAIKCINHGVLANIFLILIICYWSGVLI